MKQRFLAKQLGGFGGGSTFGLDLLRFVCGSAGGPADDDDKEGGGTAGGAFHGTVCTAISVTSGGGAGGVGGVFGMSACVPSSTPVGSYCVPVSVPDGSACARKRQV